MVWWAFDEAMAMVQNHYDLVSLPIPPSSILITGEKQKDCQRSLGEGLDSLNQNENFEHVPRSSLDLTRTDTERASIMQTRSMHLRLR